MARFPGFGPDAYNEKHRGEEVPNFKVNGREGTDTPDPASLKRPEKPLTRKQEESSDWQ